MLTEDILALVIVIFLSIFTANAMLYIVVKCVIRAENATIYL